MVQSKIEQKLQEIYEFIEDEGRPVRFSQNMIQIPKDVLYQHLDELKDLAPDEIHRYQKVISNREEIIEKANKTAAQIVEQARKQAAMLVDESAITKEAYDKAQLIVSRASEEANAEISQARALAEQITSGAYGYTEKLMNDSEAILTKAYNESVENCRVLVESLVENIQIVQKNRSELPTYDIEAELSRQVQQVQNEQYESAPEHLFDDIEMEENE